MSCCFQTLDNLATAIGKQCLRVAETLSKAQILRVMCLPLLLVSHLKDEDIAAFPFDEWLSELAHLVMDIVAVNVSLPASEDDVEVAATDKQLPEGDDEDRHVAVEKPAQSDGGPSGVASCSAPRLDALEVEENAPVPQKIPGYIAMAYRMQRAVAGSL